jgi:hypothetical protein
MFLKKIEYPKWIINDGRLIIGRVEFHRDFMKDNSKTIGGGWWYHDTENNTMYLYGASTDFGAVMEDDARKAWDESVHAERGIKMVFSYKTKLGAVLEDEKRGKAKNPAVLFAVDKEGNRERIGIANNVTIPAHIGVDYGDPKKDIEALSLFKKDEPVIVFGGGIGVGGKSMLASKLAEAGAILIALPEIKNEKIISASLEAIDKQQKEEMESALLAAYPDQSYPVYPRQIDLPTFTTEKKKKKPCTYHEYVKQAEDKEEYAYGSIVREKWKCRHCNHPLNG